MKSNVFGSVVATAVAGMMVSGAAMADGAKKADAKKADKPKAPYCESASCAAKVAGATNTCAGQQACKTVKTKEQCEAGGAGKWHAK